jgi:hypothetical protein
MQTALHKGRPVRAADFGPKNPAPTTDLVCPVCRKPVHWRPHIKEPPSGAHFAHLVTRGSCVNPEGIRRPRSSSRSSSPSRLDELVFRPRLRQRASVAALAQADLGIVYPVRAGGTAGNGGTRIPIRNAADAVRQQTFVEADASGTLRDLSIDFGGLRFPWSVFYFPRGAYLEIHRLYELNALPPFIAVEVRRDLHPHIKLRFEPDEVPCRFQEDRAGGVRVQPVVKNSLGVAREYFDQLCVVIAPPVIIVRPGNRGWQFPRVHLELRNRDFIALR